jgi:hypothetical protein
LPEAQVPLPPLPGQQPKWDRLVATAVVESEVSEAAFPAMVAEIERGLGLVGHASVMGGTLTWSPATQGEQTRRIVVQVAARDGRTAIRIQEDLELQGWRKLAIPGGIVTGGAFGAVVAGMGGMGEPAGPMLVIVCAFLGVFFGIRSGTGFAATSREPVLQLLAKTLARMVSMPVLEPVRRADALELPAPPA